MDAKHTNPEKSKPANKKPGLLAYLQELVKLVKSLASCTSDIDKTVTNIQNQTSQPPTYPPVCYENPRRCIHPHLLILTCVDNTTLASLSINAQATLILGCCFLRLFRWCFGFSCLISLRFPEKHDPCFVGRIREENGR